MIEKLIQNREFANAKELIDKDISIITKRPFTLIGTRKKPGKFIPQLVISLIKKPYPKTSLKPRFVSLNDEVIEFCIYLARKLPDINHQFSLLGTFFQFSLEAGSSYLLKELVELGADVDVVDSKYGHLIFKSMYSAEMVEVFLEQGIDPNIKDKQGRTIIHHTAFGVGVDVVRKLAKYNAELNELDFEGNSPLMLLAKGMGIGDTKDRVEVINYLLNNGADIGIKNNSNEEIIDILSESSDVEDFLPVFAKYIEFDLFDKDRTFHIFEKFINNKLYKELKPLIEKFVIMDKSNLYKLITIICTQEECDYIEYDKFSLVLKIISVSHFEEEAIHHVFTEIGNCRNNVLKRYASSALCFKNLNNVLEIESDDFTESLAIMREDVGKKDNSISTAKNLSELFDLYLDLKKICCFDVESISEEGSYTALLKDVAKLADDWEDFIFIEKWEGNSICLAVKNELRSLDVKLKLKGDIVDDQFFEFIYDISKYFLEKRFYLLPAIDQVVRIVYMPDTLAELLKRNDLL